MSTEEHMSVDERTDASLGDVPAGEVMDNDYISRTGQKQAPIPVQSDSDNVEDPIDGAKADTDEALEKDDADAIDGSNIVEGRTRGAAKPSGSYKEPGDNEGLTT